MHKSVQNLVNIEDQIKSNLSGLNITKLPKIIAVSKTFKMDKILPLIEHGHEDFGENKVQEAARKWFDLKSEYNEIKLSLIGPLQTNKIKLALDLFETEACVPSVK